MALQVLQCYLVEPRGPGSKAGEGFSNSLLAGQYDPSIEVNIHRTPLVNRVNFHAKGSLALLLAISGGNKPTVELFLSPPVVRGLRPFG